MICIPLKRPRKRANQQRKSYPLIESGALVLGDSVISDDRQECDENSCDIHSKRVKQLTYQIPFRLC